MKDYEQEISKNLAANPAIGRLPGFEVKTLTEAFQRGQEAGVKAEEAPVLQQIEAQVLTARDPRTVSLHPIEPRPDTAILGESVGFRIGYIAGLQEFLTAHNVDMKWMLDPNATPEGLRSDDTLVGYLQGMRRQSPNRGRDVFQRTVAEKPFNKFRDYEPEPEWLSRFRAQTAQQQGGYKLGFLVGVARDFDVTLTGLEIPSDNPSYEAFMQGSRGETRAMPIELKPKTDKYEINEFESKDYGLGLGGIWVYDALDDSAYKVGQRVWLASEGVDAFYAHFIRHPEALRAFKAALEGQVLPEYTKPSALDSLTSPRRTRLDDDLGLIRSEKYLLNEEEYPKKYKSLFDEPQRSNPFEEARQAGKTGYEMGQLARQGRQRAK